VTIIIRDVPIDDLALAIRAARWLSERDHKDSILCYGEGKAERCFYARRNKSSISVRPDH
jgi:hypothetical protein